MKVDMLNKKNVNETDLDLDDGKSQVLAEADVTSTMQYAIKLDDQFQQKTSLQFVNESALTKFTGSKRSDIKRVDV